MLQFPLSKKNQFLSCWPPNYYSTRIIIIFSNIKLIQIPNKQSPQIREQKFVWMPSISFRYAMCNNFRIGSQLHSNVHSIISIRNFLYIPIHRSLRCPRITVHKNLFTSFGINNFLWLLWYQFVIPTPSVSFENGVSHLFLQNNWVLSPSQWNHYFIYNINISAIKY